MPVSQLYLTSTTTTTTTHGPHLHHPIVPTYVQVPTKKHREINSLIYVVIDETGESTE